MDIDHLWVVLSVTCDGNTLRLVAVLVATLPECLCTVIGETGDHGLPAGCLELGQRC